MNVWHYTAWAKLPEIVDSGVLRPSNAGAPNEIALLWFSVHQKWEPTATKGVIFGDGHCVREITFSQQLLQFGCVRFGIPANDRRLLPWTAACIAASTPRAERRALEAAGKRRGADPAQWFGMVAPLSIDECVFEIFGEGAWHPADAREMAAVWTKSR